MAKHYWETTYPFRADTDVPFEYVCGSCGKTVRDTRNISCMYSYRKTAGKREDLALSDFDRKHGEATVRDALVKDSKLRRKREIIHF